MSVAAPMTLNAFPAKLKPPAPSCVNEPSKLNPCPIVCYVLVLTKEQGKGKWGLPKKNLAKALDDYLAKEGCLEHPFSKQILRNYQPCVSTPKTPEQHKECVNQQNTVYHKFCPILYPATLEEHPINNNDLDRVALAQHLLYHSKGEMLRREQSKGHSKGTRAWQKNIQSL